ncbi:MAG: hypothetical protein F6K41_38990, partial [Symploca sp. SIO3E6]|nr:hypothetical protein [Caldora sp. SIO3E6]
MGGAAEVEALPTSAMEMVAASKMRKAQDRMALGRPYASRIRAVIG